MTTLVKKEGEMEAASVAGKETVTAPLTWNSSTPLPSLSPDADRDSLPPSLQKLSERFAWESIGQWKDRSRFLSHILSHVETHGWEDPPPRRAEMSPEEERMWDLEKHADLSTTTAGGVLDSGGKEGEDRVGEKEAKFAGKADASGRQSLRKQELLNISQSRLKDLVGMFYNVKYLKCEYENLALRQIDYFDGQRSSRSSLQRDGDNQLNNKILCWRKL